MWTLPILIVGATIALSLPLGVYMAKVMDGRLRVPGFLRWVEQRIDTGPQDWKRYSIAMLLWNALAFVVAFLILQFQPYLPLNPDHKGMLSPTTVFNTLCSFLSNTNLQHYSGEVHLSYFSQIFVICWKQFHTPAIGLAALAAVIRGLRGDGHMGNFYVDLWRATIYVMLPASLVVGVLLIAGGMPMTLSGAAHVFTLEGGEQFIARGPVAAIVAIKQLGTNGGGFFGPNCTHPFENPSDWTNVLSCVCIILIPMAAVVMFGRMLKNFRHAAVIFGVMLVFLTSFIGWAVYWDSMQPNPSLAGQAERSYQIAGPSASGEAHRDAARGGGPAGRSRAGKPGRQGAALRHLRRPHLGGLHHLHVQRLGGLYARQPQPSGGPRADGRHVAELQLRRRRRGPD